MFYKLANHGLYVHFRSFQTTSYKKYVCFSDIQTQIVKVEGKHADR